MHDYTIDGQPKEKILFVLAFIAITFTPWLNRLTMSAVSVVGQRLGISLTLAVGVGVMAAFGCVYFGFNRYLWRIRPLRRVLLVPDLNGCWGIKGLTVLRDGQSVAEEWFGTATITQSWSKILIVVKTSNSESKSVSASVVREPGNGYRVIYHYVNDPGPRYVELHSHHGTAEIVFDETLTAASGHYFTDRARRTVGELQLERKLA